MLWGAEDAHSSWVEVFNFIQRIYKQNTGIQVRCKFNATKMHTWKQETASSTPRIHHPTVGKKIYFADTHTIWHRQVTSLLCSIGLVIKCNEIVFCWFFHHWHVVKWPKAHCDLVKRVISFAEFPFFSRLSYRQTLLTNKHRYQVDIN